MTAANEQLVRTNVDFDNFMYTASHDLKAPISNIEGLLYLLQEELPAEVAQDAEIGPTLTRMLDSLERFKRTIDHFLSCKKKTRPPPRWLTWPLSSRTSARIWCPCWRKPEPSSSST